MADDTSEFFKRLGDRGFEPSLESMTGSIRIDVREGRRSAHWRIDIRRGHIAVSKSDAAADCVVGVDREHFDGVASGRLNAMAAMLRGVISFEGNAGMLVRFQGLFPAGEHQPMGDSARTVGRQRS